MPSAKNGKNELVQPHAARTDQAADQGAEPDVEQANDNRTDGKDNSVVKKIRDFSFDIHL
jgi:hypothetical protein